MAVSLSHRHHASGPGLTALQTWLFDSVTRPRAWTESEHGASADEVRARITAHGLLPAPERLEIYRRGYWSRLVECLGDDYPAVAHALGSAVFHDLCHDFILAHPPASSSLNFYGAPFAAFCANRAEADPGLAFVAELARLEWALVEAIHADTERVLDAAALAASADLDWERAQLQPSPALTVLSLSYPVHVFYQAFVDDRELTVPEPEACVVAVCRRGDHVWRVPVRPAFAPVLLRLEGGDPLAEALRALVDDGAEGVAERAAALQAAFGEWVTCGFFSGIATAR